MENERDEIQEIQVRKRKKRTFSGKKKINPRLCRAGSAMGLLLSVITAVLMVVMFLIPESEGECVWIVDQDGYLYRAGEDDPVLGAETTVLAISSDDSRFLYLKNGELYLKGEETWQLDGGEIGVTAEPICYDENLEVIAWSVYNRRDMNYNLYLWRQETGTVCLEQGVPFLSYIRFSEDLSRLAYTVRDTAGGNALKVRNLTDDSLRQLVTSGDYLTCYGVMNDGEAVYYDYARHALEYGSARVRLLGNAVQVQVDEASGKAAAIDQEGALYYGDYRNPLALAAEQANEIRQVTENGVYYMLDGSLYYTGAGMSHVQVLAGDYRILQITGNRVLFSRNDGIYWCESSGRGFTKPARLCDAGASAALQKSTGACFYVQNGMLYKSGYPGARPQRMGKISQSTVFRFFL